MASEASISMLCADLGFVLSGVDSGVLSLLTAKVDAAAAELFDAGITVDESDPRDLDLLVMYAAWLYRARIKSEEKPLMLQRLIRNRQTAQIAGGAT